MRKVPFLLLCGSLAGSLTALLGAESFAQSATAQAFLQSVYAPYQKSDKAKKPTTVTLDLTKTAPGWRIADIHYAGQPDSLVAILTKTE